MVVYTKQIRHYTISVYQMKSHFLLDISPTRRHDVGTKHQSTHATLDDAITASKSTKVTV